MLTPTVFVGQELELPISEVGKKGDGVGYVDGLVVFVPNTKPGDVAKIKILSVASRYANAFLLSITKRRQEGPT